MKLLFCILLLSSIQSAWSQVFENEAAAREKHFIYEVKQIDEFFERFNNDSSSFIRDVYKQKGIKFKIERPALIRSLFNVVSHSWSASQVDSFIIKAMAIQMPSRKDYYGEGWFAEAICQFNYNGNTLDIPVILRVSTDKSKHSKWIIAGIRQTSIKADGKIIDGGNSISIDHFISPVSHTNYFIELEKAFDDKAYLFSYFDPTILQKSQSVVFYNAILKNQVKFLHVKEIKYHFLQVSDYIFTVENFQRDALNSGWLINRLWKASPTEKENFKRTLLGE